LQIARPVKAGRFFVNACNSPMKAIYSRFLSKYNILSLRAEATGDVGVDVTGAPGKLPVEGAGSAQAVAVLPCRAESNTGAPFFLFPAAFQRHPIGL